MKRLLVAFIILFQSCQSFATVVGANDTWFDGTSEQFSLDFVTIDDPGNPAKTGTGNAWDPGSVPYTFKIAKYETPWFAARTWLAHANVYTTMKSSVTGLLMTGTNSDNRPVVRPIYRDAMQLVNYLNVSKGYPRAYNLDVDGRLRVWPAARQMTLGGVTNAFRNARAKWFLPTLDEAVKAAQWDKGSQAWKNYGVGTTAAPNYICGFYGGSGLTGCEVINQQLDQRYPEYDYLFYPSNSYSVTLTTSAGGITGVTLGSYLSGFSTTNDTTTGQTIVQGNNKNGKIRVSAWGSTAIPATFQIDSGGSGYNSGWAYLTNGTGTVTLGADTMTVNIYSTNGVVVGIYPTGGRWTTVDTNTVVPIVQGAVTNATCHAIRYFTATTPSTLGTITAAGSGYVNGAAVLWTVGQPNIWQNLSGTAAQPWEGAAPYNEAGGLSPFGVMGMDGNVHEYGLQGVTAGSLSDVNDNMGFYSGFWNLGVGTATGLWLFGEWKTPWENSIFGGTNEGGFRLVEIP